MIPTRDHNEIRLWAQKHNAVPAEVRLLKFDGEPSVLHFLMGAARSGTPELHPIQWADFFARFDLLGLAFAYDDRSSQFAIVHLDKNKTDDEQSRHNA